MVAYKHTSKTGGFIKVVFLLFLPALLLTATPAFAYEPKTLAREAVVMGTDLKIKIYVTNEKEEEAAQKGFDAVIAEFNRIEDMMSEWKEGSPLSQVNKNSGIKPVKVPDELYKVIDASMRVSAITNGAFDVTWAAMRGIWKFNVKKPQVPKKSEIKKRLPLVNYKNVALDDKNKTVFLKKKGMAIGLGAIAKGYAVDMATV